MNPDDARETRSTCPYCGVGCGVVIASSGNQITGVRGDPDHPANYGRLCTKGATLHMTATAAVTRQTRLLQPLHRTQRGAAPRAISWDAALDQAATGFGRIIREHGPDAVGFYISGQLLTEDYYVFNKLAKGLVGTNNIDSNSRLCMSSAVAGYKQSLGADAPPACYDDLQHAHCIFIAGANPAFAHPVLFRRMEDAKRARPDLKIIVVDPRRTDSAEIADLHLALQPGTDVPLFQGLLHIMLWEGWLDTGFIGAHTRGFEALRSSVRDATPELVAQTCGLRKDDLLTAARWFATSPASLSLYCQGLNQSSSGTAKNTALINLPLATGQIGKPGAGPLSLTGQPNAMGGREVGGMANLLSAHRDMDDPAQRAEVAALWGVPDVPSSAGKKAVQMFEAAADGAIRALWICCTNPAQSMPDQAMVRRALQRAELVVVQDAFAGTATGAYADLLLPASTWGEKEGTVTNSERRISRVRAAVAAPGQARADWSIAAEFARRLERTLGPTAAGRTGMFAYADAESVWNEHRDTTRGRDLDITGMSYSVLEHAGPQQWPMPTGADSGTARLYQDGVFPTPDGRAQFVVSAYRPVAEPRDARYPFALNSGRLRDQWHGMSRTGTLGRLFSHAPEPSLDMHPQDMARRQLTHGDLVQVTSRRGSILVPVASCPNLGLGQVHIAMHWGEEALSGCSSTGERLAGVNALTLPTTCPASGQPELKHAAVKVLKAELPWTLLALAWLDDDTVLQAQTGLRDLMRRFPFAVCVPFATQTGLADGTGTRTGLLFRAAAHETPPETVLDAVEHLLGLNAPQTLRYADRRRGQRRAIRLVRSDAATRLDAFLLAGDTSAEGWIRTLLQEQLGAEQYGRLLLRPGAQPPVAVPSRGKAVCSCFNVAQTEIESALARCTGTQEERMGTLQRTLQCGTNCGSCIPELQRLVRASLRPAHAAA